MIGNQLQHLLKINGFNISGEMLLEDLGLNQLTLEKYLKNEQGPTLEDIVQHANFINTSVDYIVGNSEYVLDTWDFNFLEEFFRYSSKKIKAHFENQYNTQIPNEDNLDPILFGLLTYMTLSRTGKSLRTILKKKLQTRKMYLEK